MCFSLTNSATASAPLLPLRRTTPATLGHALPLQPHDRRPNVFREAYVRGQSSLIRFARVLPQVGIDNKELGIHGLGHARPARHQVLRRRVRADAYRNALADINRSSIFLFLSAVLF